MMVTNEVVKKNRFLPNRRKLIVVYMFCDVAEGELSFCPTAEVYCSVECFVLIQQQKIISDVIGQKTLLTSKW
jgi:hypothetical protein